MVSRAAEVFALIPVLRGVVAAVVVAVVAGAVVLLVVVPEIRGGRHLRVVAVVAVVFSLRALRVAPSLFHSKAAGVVGDLCETIHHPFLFAATSATPETPGLLPPLKIVYQLQGEHPIQSLLVRVVL